MTETPVKTLDLKNGMQLNLYDASRKLAGDRWMVSLIARMEVPVTEVLEGNGPQSTENVNDMKDVLGERVIFEQKREKIFVDTAEKERVFKKMCDMFLGSSLDYLSKENFPKQFILKKYKEEIKKASLLKAGKETG
jgi:hypothetical protein